jgi:hypothetical protein
MIVDHFAYGTTACNIESIFHFIGILVQFLSIMCIGWRNYLAIVHEYVISYKVAEYIILVVWSIAITGTIISGTYSEIYLMPSGTYCFYTFTSPAFLYWFVPVMLGALFSLTFCYTTIYCYTRQMEKVQSVTKMEREVNLPMRRRPSLSSFPPHSTVKINNKYIISNSPRKEKNEQIQRWQHRREKTRMSLNVAKQSSIYIVLFFLGWITAVVCSFFELSSHKHVPQGADVTLAIFAVLHTTSVPIVYGLSSERVRSSLVRRHQCFNSCFKCCGYCRCCKRILKNSRNSNGTIGTTNYTVKQIRANPLV